MQNTTQLKSAPVQEVPPPHNIEAEQALLGALLMNNDVYDAVSLFFSHEHFFDPLHQRIWSVSVDLISIGQRATPISLKPYFEAEPPIGQLTVPMYLGRLLASATSLLNAADYAKTLVELFTRRELILISDEIRASAYAVRTDSPASEEVKRAEQMLFALAETGQTKPQETFAETMRDLVAQVVNVDADKSRSPGLRCGMKMVDGGLGGFQNSDLIVLAARPSMGKTALALNIAVQIAENHLNWESGKEYTDDGKRLHAGCPVGFFSLEMSRDQLGLRVLSHMSAVSSTALQRGEVGDRLGKVVEAGERAAKLPLHIDDTGGLSIADLTLRARKMVRQHGVGLIVVDYLQIMNAGRFHQSKVGDVTEISNGLKRIAKELCVPVLTLSQLSRALETRQDKRPQLSDLRESGAIEQDADVVMFVYRDEYYLSREEPSELHVDAHREWEAKMDAAEGKAEIITAKHRRGSIGTNEMFFRAEITRFADALSDFGPSI